MITLMLFYVRNEAVQSRRSVWAPQWPEAIRLGKSGQPEIEQANLHRRYSPVFIPSLDMLQHYP